MNLKGSASDAGYAMAALLVAMAVMAVLLTVAMPTWKQTVQREKEEELIFRGTQYARAIGAYQRKYANASPTSFDVLVEQHFLRKKYKDPVAVTQDGEFQPLYVGTPAAGSTGTLASPTPSGGGIIGVVSKNTAASIATYNGGTHYNEWMFIALQQSTQAGTARQGGQGGQAGRGTQGTQNTQGRQGTQGTRGTQGTQGTQGRQGTQGTQGRQSTQGTQQGRQGTVSTQGQPQQGR
jgi:type II secretory pathway pseudopilin PulG